MTYNYDYFCIKITIQQFLLTMFFEILSKYVYYLLLYVYIYRKISSETKCSYDILLMYGKLFTGNLYIFIHLKHFT